MACLGILALCQKGFWQCLRLPSLLRLKSAPWQAPHRRQLLRHWQAAWELPQQERRCRGWARQQAAELAHCLAPGKAAALQGELR